jgi:hypothetical protein
MMHTLRHELCSSESLPFFLGVRMAYLAPMELQAKELQTKIDELNTRIKALQKGVRICGFGFLCGIVYYSFVRPTWFPQRVITCERLIIVDKDGNMVRSVGGTDADGTVLLPTEDRKK